MKLCKRRLPGLSLALLVAGTLGASEAAAETRSGTVSRTYGSPYAGCKVLANGIASNEGETCYAYVYGSARLKVLGKTVPAASVAASARRTATTGSAGLRVRAGGMTILEKAYTASATKNWSTQLSLLSVSKTFWVFIAPVTVRADLGAGAQLGISLTLEEAPRTAGVAGLARAWGYGRASAALGVSGLAELSAELELDFARLRIEPSLVVHLTDISAVLELGIDPVRFLIRLCLELFWVIDDCREVADFTFGSRQYANILS